MSSYPSKAGPIVIASLAMFTSALGVLTSFTFDGQTRQPSYSGGLGHLGEIFGIVVWLIFAGAFTLFSVLTVFVLALVRRRWIWAGVLIGTTALGCLGLAESTSDVVYSAVSLVVGVRSSWVWSFIAEFIVILLVSLIALIPVLAVERRSRKV